MILLLLVALVAISDDADDNQHNHEKDIIPFHNDLILKLLAMFCYTKVKRWHGQKTNPKLT